MLGSSNIDAGPVMAFMTGNLVSDRASPVSDLPSNRLAEISVRVRQVCDKYDLPYTMGSCWCSTARRGHNRQAVVAEQVPVRPGRRRTAKPAARRCSPSSSRHSSGPTRQPGVGAG